MLYDFHAAWFYYLHIKFELMHSLGKALASFQYIIYFVLPSSWRRLSYRNSLTFDQTHVIEGSDAVGQMFVDFWAQLCQSTRSMFRVFWELNYVWGQVLYTSHCCVIIDPARSFWTDPPTLPRMPLCAAGDDPSTQPNILNRQSLCPEARYLQKY